MNALGFQEIKVVALAADNLARAKEFYRTKLELIPAFDGDEDSVFALGQTWLADKGRTSGWRSATEIFFRLRLLICRPASA